MKIEKILIENFKCYESKFSLCLNSDINILVGNNEAGKSTILEALHLALTGMLNGRYLKNELSQYLFNNKVEHIFLENIRAFKPTLPPRILIELYIEDDGSPEAGLLKGNGNSLKENSSGIIYEVKFDSAYSPLYEELIKKPEELKTIPIEYYKTSRRSFARKEITSQLIPIKSSLIDSSGNRGHSGSDIYISRIIKNNLEDSGVCQHSCALNQDTATSIFSGFRAIIGSCFQFLVSPLHRDGLAILAS